MSFERIHPGVRYVETVRGDTLRRVALRELGDASKWVDIAILNGLRPPYIVDDPAAAADGVIVAGDILSVSAPQTIATVATDADRVFFRDLLLTNGLLSDESGDIERVSGLDNLTQALTIRIGALKTELMFHPEYGCHVRQLLGEGNSATAQAMAAFYVKSALLEDNRVSSVESVTATTIGDVIRIEAMVIPITGRTIPINALIK